jgi:eukaryotic-like serine/threonine-protein kinase
MHENDEKTHLGNSSRSPGKPELSFDAGEMELGDFILLERIGEGGMGVVYRARKRGLEREVALKMLPSSLAVTSADIMRFRQEAESMSALDHPNIVPVYEAGEIESQPYLCMRLIDGGSLADFMRDRRFQPKAAVELLVKISGAIAAAHRLGILHRDLKPANVLLDSHGEPQVTDFGLAKRLGGEETEKLTLTGQSLGTPAYMAPEQVMAAAGTTSVDVYGLGGILYSLLTGRAPFKGKSVPDVMRQVTEEEVDALRKQNTAVDRDLEAIVLKCLEKTPRDRYGSADALVQDLELWLGGMTISARPVSSFQQTLRWVRRKPAQAGTLTAVALLVLTFAIGGPLVAWNQTQLREKADTAQGDADRARETAEASADDLRRQLYFSEMNEAGSAKAEPGGLARIDELLSNWEPASGESDLRGWEWRHFRHVASKNAGEIVWQSDQPIGAVAFSQDGKRRAIATLGLIAVWEGAEQMPIWERPSIPTDCRNLTFSPDGRYLAANLLRPSTVLVLDATTGTEIRRWRSTYNGNGMAWSPKGDLIAVASGQGAQIFDLDTGQDFARFEDGYNPNADLAWLPDGSGVICGGHPGGLYFLPARPGAPAETWLRRQAKLRITALALSPNGRSIALGDAVGVVRLFDVKGRSISYERKAHKSRINGLAWSPNGRQFTTVGEDYGVRLWNAESGWDWGELRGHRGSVKGVLWSASDRMFTWSDDGTLRAWRPSAHERIRSRDKESIRAVAWSPDGKRVAAAYSQVIVLDESDPAAMPQHFDIRYSDSADIVWMPDGKSIALFAREQIVVMTPQEFHADQLPSMARRLHVHRKAGWDLELSPVHPWIASCGHDAIRISDHQSGEVIMETDADQARKISFHPDGTLVAVSYLNRPHIDLVAVPTGQLTPLSKTAGRWAHAIDFHPDGNLIASGSNTGLIEFWEHPSGSRRLVLAGHTGGINELDFSPDGQRLASASYDATVRIWDVETGIQICVLAGHEASVFSVAWSPDGTTLASSDWTGEVRVWRSSDK